MMRLFDPRQVPGRTLVLAAAVDRDLSAEARDLMTHCSREMLGPDAE